MWKNAKPIAGLVFLSTSTLSNLCEAHRFCSQYQW